MNSVLKIGGKVLLVFVGAFALGYAEYRIKGGKPVHKLYTEVRNERRAKEAREARRLEGLKLIEKGLKANG